MEEKGNKIDVCDFSITTAAALPLPSASLSITTSSVVNCMIILLSLAIEAPLRAARRSSAGGFCAPPHTSAFAAPWLWRAG